MKGEAGRESRKILRFPTWPPEAMVMVVTEPGN